MQKWAVFHLISKHSLNVLMSLRSLIWAPLTSSLDVRPWMRVTIFLKQITEKKSCYLNLYLVFGTKHTLPKFSQALVIVIKTEPQTSKLIRCALPITNWANKPTGSRSLSWLVINSWKDDDEIWNIWKSYIGIEGWRIKWKKIIGI